MTTSVGLGVVIDTMSLTMYAGPWLTASRRSNEALTADESNFVPSWNVTPERRVSVYVVLSADFFHAVARPGARTAVAEPSLYDSRPSYKFCVRRSPWPA